MYFLVPSLAFLSLYMSLLTSFLYTLEFQLLFYSPELQTWFFNHLLDIPLTCYRWSAKTCFHF